jgi:conjugative transfer region lipoprotein (TIGR03751 family)
MKAMVTRGVKILGLAGLLSLTACSSSPHKSGVLPEEGPSMAAIYNGQFESEAGDPGLTQARAKVPKNIPKETGSVSTKAPLDTQNNVPDTGPKMLPNSTIKIYVYPHFDQADQNYIPGHLAYTKLYEEAHFALPGENGE